VKGNAYGHGLDVFTPLAHECGVRHFSVFSAEEAFQAARVLKKPCEIMIMGQIDNHDVAWAIRHGIDFFVFDIGRLETALQVAGRTGIAARIHLEVETGLNRTGFDKKGLLQACDMLRAAKGRFVLNGVCTHYAGAEHIANYVRIVKQIRGYQQYMKWLGERGFKPRMQHTACSAAAMSYAKTRMDMVRIGIMQYGYWPSRETLISHLSKQADKTDPLRRVITWKSTVMNIQEVKAGEFIGYGSSYMAENDMRVAVVPVGYAMGYSRSLSNQGRVLIRGHRLSVVGLVNMNMLTIDVSNVPETRIGDEVILVGSQGEQTVSVSSFSELSAQLNYELLTRLPRDIPRVVTN
jgi:alanine racemase